MSIYNNCLKRPLDIALSFAGMVVLLPIFIAEAIIIKMDSPGNIFFKQERVGRGGKIFTLVKFRTMRVDPCKEKLLFEPGTNERVTRVGYFLRNCKLDELPQLWNVLKGDMSLVGPRPEVSKYVEMFKNDYHEILKVRPGITDYASVEFSDEEKILKKYKNPEAGYIQEVLPIKIKLYAKYAKKQTIFTDLSLILMTFRKIFTQRS